MYSKSVTDDEVLNNLNILSETDKFRKEKLFESISYLEKFFI